MQDVPQFDYKWPKINGFHWGYSTAYKWSYGPLLITGFLGFAQDAWKTFQKIPHGGSMVTYPCRIRKKITYKTNPSEPWNPDWWFFFWILIYHLLNPLEQINKSTQRNQIQVFRGHPQKPLDSIAGGDFPNIRGLGFWHIRRWWFFGNPARKPIWKVQKKPGR